MCRHRPELPDRSLQLWLSIQPSLSCKRSSPLWLAPQKSSLMLLCTPRLRLRRTQTSRSWWWGSLRAWQWVRALHPLTLAYATITPNTSSTTTLHLWRRPGKLIQRRKWVRIKYRQRWRRCERWTLWTRYAHSSFPVSNFDHLLLLWSPRLAEQVNI